VIKNKCYNKAKNRQMLVTISTIMLHTSVTPSLLSGEYVHTAVKNNRFVIFILVRKLGLTLFQLEFN